MESPARAAAMASGTPGDTRAGATSRTGDLFPGPLVLFISSIPPVRIYSVTAMPCRARACVTKKYKY